MNKQLIPDSDSSTQMTDMETNQIDEEGKESEDGAVENRYVKFEEFTYISENGNHEWKRIDVAMLLLGIFNEDIQMFCLRNSTYNLVDFIQAIINTKPQGSLHMQRILRGRMLWCSSACSECLLAPTEQNLKVKNDIIDISIEMLKKTKVTSVKLVATRTLVKYARKMKKEDLLDNATKFESILDDLLSLLDISNKDVMHLPIEAFQTFSKVNEQTVSQMAPKITPKLLLIFKNEHSQGNLGQELLNLFKQWCQYDDCRDIFINTFVPFIMEIIECYYSQTPNDENKDIILKESLSSSLDSSNDQNSQNLDQKIISVVDSTIL